MIVAKSLLEYLTDPTTGLLSPRAVEDAAQEILRIIAEPEREGGATYSLRCGDQFSIEPVEGANDDDATRD